ncbi:hypothetical protein RFI_28808 [Reticulomyxa filosa]|uniref:VASt domain-containing protein n=1 Tax=Reticulomyxa filosa TaxID=46433 RepID=X6M3S5_RETFI|nr:hypothetical protein RFI_28808 [Reticulomyxa filosa]|eukprot:ETO08579.1 hypothetical protein RFI_28808 [Reticulomyxa filosa]
MTATFEIKSSRLYPITTIQTTCPKFDLKKRLSVSQQHNAKKGYRFFFFISIPALLPIRQYQIIQYNSPFLKLLQKPKRNKKKMKELKLNGLFTIEVENLFKCCFENVEFEERFLTIQLENVPLGDDVLAYRRPSQHVTVTQWIFDPNQRIPGNAEKEKGVHTRMKFYKIRDPSGSSQGKGEVDIKSLIQVTETQKKNHKHMAFTFFFLVLFLCRVNQNKTKSNQTRIKPNKKKLNLNVFKYWMTKINAKQKHEIQVNSLVLPQSSLTVEPVFRIEVNWTLSERGVESLQTVVDIHVKVECSKKSWGMESIVERVLLEQAKQTYQNWLDFATLWVPFQLQKANAISPGVGPQPVKEQECFTSNVGRSKHSNVLGLHTELKKRTTTAVDGKHKDVEQIANPNVSLDVFEKEEEKEKEKESVNSTRHNLTSSVETLSARLISSLLQPNHKKGLNASKKFSLLLTCQRCFMRLCPSFTASGYQYALTRVKHSRNPKSISEEHQMFEHLLCCFTLFVFIVVIFFAVISKLNWNVHTHI